LQLRGADFTEVLEITHASREVALAVSITETLLTRWVRDTGVVLVKAPIRLVVAN